MLENLNNDFEIEELLENSEDNLYEDLMGRCPPTTDSGQAF